jgi:Fur family transcriptional regulator, ferric uptake regulator
MSASIDLTPRQAIILNLLKALDREVSAQSLYAELRHQQQNLGLATVYRALKHLQLQGVVQTRTLPNGEMVYRPVAEDQHYLTCVKCGTSVPLEHCPVNEQVLPKAVTPRFKIFYHTLEFFGLCSPCLDQESAV